MFGNYYFISCVKVACVNAFWAKNFSVKKVSSVKRFVTKQKNCHNSRNTLGDRGWNNPPSLRYILFYDFSVTHLNFMNLVNFLEIFLGLIFLTFFKNLNWFLQFQQIQDQLLFLCLCFLLEYIFSEYIFDNISYIWVWRIFLILLFL